MTSKSNAELLNLCGESAIVTGGGQGIGRAVSMRLGAAGASVIVADIDLETAEATVDIIKGEGGQAQAVQADVGNRADVEAMIKSAVDSFGRLDILVNNAGVVATSSVRQTGAEILHKTFSVNLMGPFICSQMAAEEMIKAERGGKIINASSVAAYRPIRDMVHYGASKGGVASMTQAMALEYGRHNIRVNAVAPAGIITSTTQRLTQAGVAVSGRNEDELLKGRIRRTALGRMGEPDDIATVVLFLASDASSYMTGSTVLVDGGFLLT